MLTDELRAVWNKFAAFTRRGAEYDRSLGGDVDPHFEAILAVDARLVLLEAEHRAAQVLCDLRQRMEDLSIGVEDWPAWERNTERLNAGVPIWQAAVKAVEDDGAG